MPPISVLIKPSSGNCNMRCKYCFYHDSTAKRKLSSRGFMSSETAENIVKKIFDCAEQNANIAFQGGEPTLIGLEYYINFVSLVKKYNTKNLPINYGLQTNGTMITEEWCEFFKENSFLVGVSLDGDKEIHNYLRNENGAGNYKLIIKNIELLKKYKIEFNILTVVTKFIAKHYKKVYDNYKKLGFGYLQFIACLDDFDNTNETYSLSAKEYGQFLVDIYKLWLNDYKNGCYISIRLFDNILNRLRGNNVELCSLQGHCSIQNVIEADGTVYPCDFYCLDEYDLGNINEKSFKQIFESEIAQNFIEQSLKVSKDCKSCNYYAICRGGCRREWLGGKNIFCDSYKMLIKEITRENSIN